MGLFHKKKEEAKSCCCGGNCTPESMAEAERKQPKLCMHRIAIRPCGAYIVVKILLPQIQ